MSSEFVEYVLLILAIAFVLVLFRFVLIYYPFVFNLGASSVLV